MRKNLLSAAFALLFSTVALAQSPALSEGFEESSVPPEGWTMRSCSDATSNKYKWEQVLYTSNPLNLRSGYTHGGSYAMMVSSGKTTSTKPAPDSWLISPQVAVTDGDNLSFMLAYAPVLNQTATVAAENRIRFDVLVSTTDTAKASFTDTLYTIQPYADTDWHLRTFNLSKYAGKNVYIAFREYGNTTTGPITLNRLWIDDVEVSQAAKADLRATELLTPKAGPNTTQEVSFKYTNSGFANTSLKACYSVNGVNAEEETLATDYACQTDDTLTYTFKLAPATLQEGDNNIKVWVTADNDAVHDNDTVSAKVTIDKTFALPYEMDATNISDGWSYTYHSGKINRGTNVGWWQVPDMTTGVTYWTYKGGATKTSILEGKWFALEEGKADITFTYTSGTEVPLSIYLTGYDADAADSFGATDTVTATLAAAETEGTQKVSLNVATANKYKIGFACADTYVGPFVVTKLNIAKSVPTDISVEDVALDSAIVAGENYSLIIKVKNNGTTDVADVPVKVAVDSVIVDEDNITSIAAGETKEWQMGSGTLTDQLHGLNLAAGKHTVTIYTLADNDQDAANDTIVRNVYAYEKSTLPFKESFETEAGNNCWTAKILGDNVLNWTIGTAKVGNVNWAKDGENAAYMSSVAGAEHNAVLRSPVISVSEAATVRLSYYYTTRMTATDASNVTLLTASVKSIAADTTFTVAQRTDSITDANQGNYKQGFLLVNLPAAGDYQLEFLNTGLGHDIVLDDIRLDSGKDIAVISAEQTAKSGFNNTVNKVTLTFANHSAVQVSGLTLTARTENSEGETTVQSVDLDCAMAAGDTISWTFDDIDISASGTYTTTVAALLSGADDDTFNDSITLASVESYANATIPYVCDFDTIAQQNAWTLEGTWQTGTYSSSSSAYNGTGAISHHKKAANADGDWAFSGCIEVPAGTYELSFFYRTFLNGKTPKLYAQNFAMYLGKEQTAEAMTQELFKSPADVIVSGKRYSRVEQTITVAESGKYYIGVKCNSQSAYGVLYIDNIEITDAAKTAPVLNEYETAFDDFYRYDPSTQFAQWTADEQQQGITATQKIFNAGNPTVELPGAIVSSAFTIPGNSTVTATLEYSMKADNAANLSDEAKTQMKTLLYISDGDTLGVNSTVMAEGTDASGEKATATATFKAEETGVHYFIVNVEGPVNCLADTEELSYCLYGLKLATEVDGISSVQQTSCRVALYSANGMKIGEYDNQTEAMKHAAPGINIIKGLDGGQATKIVK